MLILLVNTEKYDNRLKIRFLKLKLMNTIAKKVYSILLFPAFLFAYFC